MSSPESDGWSPKGVPTAPAVAPQPRACTPNGRVLSPASPLLLPEFPLDRAPRSIYFSLSPRPPIPPCTLGHVRRPHSVYAPSSVPSHRDAADVMHRLQLPWPDPGPLSPSAVQSCPRAMPVAALAGRVAVLGPVALLQTPRPLWRHCASFTTRALGRFSYTFAIACPPAILIPGEKTPSDTSDSLRSYHSSNYMDSPAQAGTTPNQDKTARDVATDKSTGSTQPSPVSPAAPESGSEILRILGLSDSPTRSQDQPAGGKADMSTEAASPNQDVFSNLTAPSNPSGLIAGGLGPTAGLGPPLTDQAGTTGNQDKTARDVATDKSTGSTNPSLVSPAAPESDTGSPTRSQDQPADEKVVQWWDGFSNSTASTNPTAPPKPTGPSNSTRPPGSTGPPNSTRPTGSTGSTHATGPSDPPDALGLITPDDLITVEQGEWSIPASVRLFVALLLLVQESPCCALLASYRHALQEIQTIPLHEFQSRPSDDQGREIRPPVAVQNRYLVLRNPRDPHKPDVHERLSTGDCLFHTSVIRKIVIKAHKDHGKVLAKTDLQDEQWEHTPDKFTAEVIVHLYKGVNSGAIYPNSADLFQGFKEFKYVKTKNSFWFNFRAGHELEALRQCIPALERDSAVYVQCHQELGTTFRLGHVDPGTVAQGKQHVCSSKTLCHVPPVNVMTPQQSQDMSIALYDDTVSGTSRAYKGRVTWHNAPQVNEQLFEAAGHKDRWHKTRSPYLRLEIQKPLKCAEDDIIEICYSEMRMIYVQPAGHPFDAVPRLLIALKEPLMVHVPPRRKDPHAQPFRLEMLAPDNYFEIEQVDADRDKGYFETEASEESQDRHRPTPLRILHYRYPVLLFRWKRQQARAVFTPKDVIIISTQSAVILPMDQVLCAHFDLLPNLPGKSCSVAVVHKDPCLKPLYLGPAFSVPGWGNAGLQFAISFCSTFVNTFVCETKRNWTNIQQIILEFIRKHPQKKDKFSDPRVWTDYFHCEHLRLDVPSELTAYHPLRKLRKITTAADGDASGSSARPGTTGQQNRGRRGSAGASGGDDASGGGLREGGASHSGAGKATGSYSGSNVHQAGLMQVDEHVLPGNDPTQADMLCCGPVAMLLDRGISISAVTSIPESPAAAIPQAVVSSVSSHVPAESVALGRTWGTAALACSALALRRTGPELQTQHSHHTCTAASQTTRTLIAKKKRRLAEALHPCTTAPVHQNALLAESYAHHVPQTEEDSDGDLKVEQTDMYMKSADGDFESNTPSTPLGKNTNPTVSPPAVRKPVNAPSDHAAATYIVDADSSPFCNSDGAPSSGSNGTGADIDLYSDVASECAFIDQDEAFIQDQIIPDLKAMMSGGHMDLQTWMEQPGPADQARCDIAFQDETCGSIHCVDIDPVIHHFEKVNGVDGINDTAHPALHPMLAGQMEWYYGSS
eukprot:gene5534-139_t